MEPFVRFTPTGVGTIAARTGMQMWHTVHPHGRGDNDRRASRPHRTTGSPPRAWGQCRCRRSGAGGRRFTPTGVGTIDDGSCEPVGMAVHPHGRGDNANGCGVCAIIRGSPPRAWGQSLHRR